MEKFAEIQIQIVVLHTCTWKKNPPIGSIFRNPCTFQSSPIYLKSLFLVHIGELWNFFVKIIDISF